MIRRLILPSLLLLTGCASEAPRPVFTNDPVVLRVADDAPIPVPEEAEFYRLSHHIENFALRQSRLRLDPREPEPALDVNRFGDVIESSWWQRRLDTLSAADVGAGPGGDDPGPEAFLPWEITGLKVGGRNPGFNIRDARGVGYIVKFDKPDAPCIATGAGAVAARLFWALGYNVPDDRVVYFTRDALHVADGASVKNSLGEKRRLTEEDIDALLARLPQALHGDRYRALVSRFIDGIPVGGFAYSGTRDDDPNDVIPHERRRSLRALRVFGAWLQHVDQKVDNTLDLYVGEPGRGHLVHYLVDFDGCLGGYWAARHEKRIGYAYDIDLREILVGIPALGLHVRPYEDLPEPEHAEIGLYTAVDYDAGGWQPNYANDFLSNCGPADAFWAGLELARITDEMIDAAVVAGRFVDPTATEVMARVLKERREATVSWALTQVTPIANPDDFVRWATPDTTVHSNSTEATSTTQKGTRVELRYPGDKLLRFIRWRDSIGYRFEGGIWRIDLIDAAGKVTRTETISSNLTPLELVESANSDFSVRWSLMTQDGHELPSTEAFFKWMNGIPHLQGVLRAGQ